MPHLSTRDYISRVLITLALVALAVAFWMLSGIFMLTFGGVVFAVILRAVADQLKAWLGLRDGLALLLAGAIFAAAMAAAGVLFSGRIAAQFGNLAQQVPAALQSLLNKFGFHSFASLFSNLNFENLLGNALFVGRNALELLTGLVYLIVGGIYVAIRPEPYQNGFVKLFPPSWHEQIADTLRIAGEALRLWFAGQLLAMLIVGVLYALGTWLIGLPAPLAFGVIAAVAEFVPLFGPVVAAVPPLLVAFSLGMDSLLWAVAVVVIVQTLESNVIIPIIVRGIVSVPPAVGALAVLAFGSLFGVLGIVFGYPLAIVADVAVRRLYIRETLQEPVTIAAEESRHERKRGARM
jgi:predicted PurR-regulated permease PerM